MSEDTLPRELVLYTSVAIKLHVPEQDYEKARQVQRAFEDGEITLLAPGTILPEVFNAFWQKYRRKELSHDEVRQGCELISELPLNFYAPEVLMPRAAQISLKTGVIVYDALFLALAEDAETVMLTADGKLLKTIEDTSYAELARSLAEVEGLLR